MSLRFAVPVVFAVTVALFPVSQVALAQARAGDDIVALSPLAPLFVQFEEGAGTAAHRCRRCGEPLDLRTVIDTRAGGPGARLRGRCGARAEGDALRREPCGCVPASGQRASARMQRARCSRRLGVARRGQRRSLAAAGRAGKAAEQRGLDDRDPGSRVALDPLRHLRPSSRRCRVVEGRARDAGCGARRRRFVRGECILCCGRPDAGAGRRVLAAEPGARCAHRRGVREARSVDGGPRLDAERSACRPQIALAAASGDGAKSSASELARAVVAQQERCRDSLQALERAATGAADQRQRAATLGEQFVGTRARDGEASACEALGRTLAVR